MFNLANPTTWQPWCNDRGTLIQFHMFPSDTYWIISTSPDLTLSGLLSGNFAMLSHFTSTTTFISTQLWKWERKAKMSNRLRRWAFFLLRWGFYSSHRCYWWLFNVYTITMLYHTETITVFFLHMSHWHQCFFQSFSETQVRWSALKNTKRNAKLWQILQIFQITLLSENFRWK